MRLWFDWWLMSWQAYWVVQMRLWRVAQGDTDELTRMVSEKQRAAVVATSRAIAAAAEGPEAMGEAALRPVRRQVRSNYRRLSRG